MESELGQFETFKRCLRVKEPIVYDDNKLDDEIEGRRTFDVEEKLVDGKFSRNLSDFLLELNGSDFDLSYIQQYGFNTPILFKSKEGLGLKMPDPMLFSVNDVKSYVGPRRVIEVFDCDTHEPGQMTVHNWIRYYTGKKRDKILNVTSLEFSQTGLQRIVECPSVVRDHLDWVPLVWPENLINEQKDTTNSMDNMKYPKVRNYVLMSVAGCYTDFHIDFGGTSVWYHVLKGGKVFWLVPPTDKNLQVYEEWTLSGRQSDVFFGDLVDECYRVNLVSGDTFMIPTGWIHGVYTPVDSLVFGGNFLHSYNIVLQLKVYDIEDNTRVPKKLRFPFFAEIHWYMIKAYVDVLERDLDERRYMEFEAYDAGAFNIVNNEINNVKEEKPKSNWHGVHLTVNELEGLKYICKRFRKWPHAKHNYPNDLKEDSMELIDRLDELLQHHEEDDQILACRGINFFKQLNSERTDSPISALNTPLNKHEQFSSTDSNYDYLRSDINKMDLDGLSACKSDLTEKKIGTSKTNVRRVRCNECKGCCNTENCNECRFCLDMPKNGGEGKLRKSCQLRYCINPQLSKYMECKICEKRGSDDNSLVLMECCVCGDIVHRSCTDVSKPYTLSKISNCWECPDCYENRNKLNSDVAIKVKEKIQNGHLNIQNLKNLIQSNKIKIKSEKKTDDESSDDEPLIKKIRCNDDKVLITKMQDNTYTDLPVAKKPCDITDNNAPLETNQSPICKKQIYKSNGNDTFSTVSKSDSGSFSELNASCSRDHENLNEMKSNDHGQCFKKKANNVYDTFIKRRASYSHDREPCLKKKICNNNDHATLVHKKIFYNTDHAPNVRNTANNCDEVLYKRKPSHCDDKESLEKEHKSCLCGEEPLLKKEVKNIENKYCVGNVPSPDQLTEPLVGTSNPINGAQSQLRLPSHCTLLTGGDHPLPQIIWERVFSYLSEKDKRQCVLVCDSWKQWCQSYQ